MYVIPVANFQRKCISAWLFTHMNHSEADCTIIDAVNNAFILQVPFVYMVNKSCYYVSNLNYY